MQEIQNLKKMGKKFENSQFLIPNSELIPAYARLEWREAFGDFPRMEQGFPCGTTESWTHVRKKGSSK